jgi:adenine-specific DNA-methyltransferase
MTLRYRDNKNYKLLVNNINNSLKGVKKDYGIFFTPEWIVNLMINMINTNHFNKKNVNILEPACGLAQFLMGIKRNMPEIFNNAQLFGVEINQDVIKYLTTLDIENIKIIKDDFLLWQSPFLFDLIIGNPPYGIPSLSEHYTIKIDPETKKKYKLQFETWYGKYNIYGAFIEKSVKLLKDEGQLIFIVPSTFMILDDFKKLRIFLSQNGRTTIIYLGSEIFKPEADVSTVILNFFKSKNFTHRLELFEYHENKINVIKVNPNWRGDVITFETNYKRNLENICSYRLGDIYEIRISPRTPEIKNCQFIRKEKSSEEDDYLPILNGRNLKCNKIIYENFTGYWIKKTDIEKLRKFFCIPHIVVGLGFREDGRIGAAIDEKCYPWMGDVYHLLKKNNLFSRNFDMNEKEVIEYLNSDYVKKYIKDTYRDITYHLSITQLKNLPLPDRKEWEKIKSGDVYKESN